MIGFKFIKRNFLNSLNIIWSEDIARYDVTSCGDFAGFFKEGGAIIRPSTADEVYCSISLCQRKKRSVRVGTPYIGL